MNPASFFEHLAGYGDAVAIRCGATGGTLSFRELAECLPVQRGNVIATWMPPDTGHLLLLLGAFANGAAICPLNPRLPRQRAIGLARSAGARWLATPEGWLETGDPPPVALLPCETVLFTSGSGGEPKAVVLPMEAHLASAEASGARIPIRPGQSWALSLPVCHVSGMSVLFRCWVSGAAVVLPDDRSEIPPATHLSLVATQLKRLLGTGSPWKQAEAVLVGGGPISPDLVNAALEQKIPLHLTYGMTETASQICTTECLAGPLDRVHVGRPLPGLEVRCAEDGSIAVRGPVVARGILERDGSVRPITGAGGWLATGDIGSMDGAGNWMIRGRSDFLMISGGENLHPEEIERVMASMPGVDCAVVVPVPDSEFGQRPVAFLAGSVGVQSLEDALRQMLPAFAIPDAIWEWPLDLPVAEGKISAGLRRILADRAAGVGTSSA